MKIKIVEKAALVNEMGIHIQSEGMGFLLSVRFGAKVCSQARRRLPRGYELHGRVVGLWNFREQGRRESALSAVCPEKNEMGVRRGVRMPDISISPGALHARAAVPMSMDTLQM